MAQPTILPHQFRNYLEKKLYEHFADAKEPVFPKEQAEYYFFQGRNEGFPKNRFFYESQVKFLLPDGSLRGTRLFWGTFYNISAGENPGNEPSGYIRLSPKIGEHFEYQTQNFQLMQLVEGKEFAPKYGFQEFHTIDDTVDVLAGIVRSKLLLRRKI